MNNNRTRERRKPAKKSKTQSRASYIDLNLKYEKIFENRTEDKNIDFKHENNKEIVK